MADLKAVGLRTDGLKADLQSRLDKHRELPEPDARASRPKAVPKRFLDDPTAQCWNDHGKTNCQRKDKAPVSAA